MVNLWDVRRQYTQGHLDESKVAEHPLTQFHAWFEEYKATQPLESNIMVLATVDANNQPWQRVVLLKSYDEQGLVFFTNYDSFKGQHLHANPKASLHFFWINMERQVQVQGEVEKLSREESAAYFHSRPHSSQLGAWASKQSQPLANRAQLEQQFAQVSAQYQDGEVPLPEFWGGFRVKPTRIEFWQGGANRLHDRVEYRLQQNSWKIQRLNP